MSSTDKAMNILLELGNPAVRRTRVEQLDHALRVALALTDGDAAVVLAPASRRTERLMLHTGSAATAQLPSPAAGSEVVRALSENPEPIVLADLAEDARLATTDGCPGVEAGPVLFAALRQRDPVPGYLAVYRRRGRARFNGADTRSMVLLAASLGSSLETLRLSSGAEKLTLTDDLTEVYNARFLKTALRREVRRAGRFGQELAIVMVEPDRFEEWCAQQGELRGSVVLKELAALLAQQVRSFDLMARIGENRFMVVLPQTARGGAIEVAERMRAAVAEHTFSAAAPGAITVSLGVSAFPQEGSEVAALTATAERALARAREQGSNRVESLFDRAA